MVKMKWRLKEDDSALGPVSWNVAHVEVTWRRLKAYMEMDGREHLIQNIVLSKLETASITTAKPEANDSVMVKLEWKLKDNWLDAGFVSGIYSRVEVTPRRLKAYTIVDGEERLLQEIVLSKLYQAIITEVKREDKCPE